MHVGIVRFEISVAPTWQNFGIFMTCFVEVYHLPYIYDAIWIWLLKWYDSYYHTNSGNSNWKMSQKVLDRCHKILHYTDSPESVSVSANVWWMYGSIHLAEISFHPLMFDTYQLFHFCKHFDTFMKTNLFTRARRYFWH